MSSRGLQNIQGLRDNSTTQHNMPLRIATSGREPIRNLPPASHGAIHRESMSTSSTECSNGSRTGAPSICPSSGVSPKTECSNGSRTGAPSVNPPSGDFSRTKCSNGSRTGAPYIGPPSGDTPRTTSLITPRSSSRAGRVSSGSNRRHDGPTLKPTESKATFPK